MQFSPVLAVQAFPKAPIRVTMSVPRAPLTQLGCWVPPGHSTSLIGKAEACTRRRRVAATMWSVDGLWFCDLQTE